MEKQQAEKACHDPAKGRKNNKLKRHAMTQPKDSHLAAASQQSSGTQLPIKSQTLGNGHMIGASRSKRPNERPYD